jgi:hypothetical protein
MVDGGLVGPGEQCVGEDGEAPDQKRMRLRYAGDCVGCGTRIEQGEWGYYLRSARVVRCLPCGPVGDREPDPAAGRSADDEAQRAAGQAEALAARHAAAQRRADAFAAGAEGERIVAEALAPLSAAGYLILHDRAAGPRANLDHLVIGPSGVWLVDAKHWQGTVTAESGELRHNGRKRTKLLEGAARQRELVVGVLEHARLVAPVRSTFAFTAAAPDPASIEQVEMVPVDRLRTLIGAADPVLDGRTADRVAAALVTAFPPAAEWAFISAVSEEELPEDLRDEGAYIFVNPWNRSGKQRLYVERFGESFGFVDLVARKVHVTSKHERARPNLEFILEWFADVDAEPRQLGRLGRLAVWVAGGAPRRAVAVRFRRPNIDRLYVHLADGKSRTQIGHADLRTGQVHAAEPEFTAIVRKAVAIRSAAEAA